jgi:hypothetical protein
VRRRGKFTLRPEDDRIAQRGADPVDGALNASANLVAALHIGYFLFVFGGTVAIIAGLRTGWMWVRNFWFRVAHAAAVFIVLFEEITGIPCVLNLLQAWLRTESIGQAEATDGVGGLLDLLLYRTISPFILDIFYWTMGVAVLLLLWIVPIRQSARVVPNH